MSGNTAFLFPGQGSQFVGMGASFISAEPEAKKRVEEANDALGFDIGKLILEGPDDTLKLTENTQPAILLVSVIALEALKRRVDVTPKAVAGHSLGEFSACFSAGAIEFADVIRLVRKRGELMQSAVPIGVGGMAAIIGLSSADVADVCKESGGVVSPANFNSPEQTVIAGKKEDVEKASALAKERGAKKAIPLSVSAPFHTSLMQPAREGLVEFMKTIKFNDPSFPVIRNVDAEVSVTADDVVDGLSRQVTGCVDWVSSMKKMAELGASTALEIGPGKVLAGLMRRIDKSIPVSLVGTMENIEKTAEVLNG